MINKIRWLFVFVSLMTTGALTLAQVDPSKVLIGRWEGQAETQKGYDQILIINSVQAKGEGEWIARGRFGPRDSISTGTGEREMAVRAKGNEIFIEFAAKGNNPVRLKLVNDNRLEGTINIVLKRAVDRRIWLDKVVPKAGDIK
jgi:hypothetical protein